MQFVQTRQQAALQIQYHLKVEGLSFYFLWWIPSRTNVCVARDFRRTLNATQVSMITAGRAERGTSGFFHASFHTCKKLSSFSCALLWQSVGSFVCTGPIVLRRERNLTLYLKLFLCLCAEWCMQAVGKVAWGLGALSYPLMCVCLPFLFVRCLKT